MNGASLPKPEPGELSRSRTLGAMIRDEMSLAAGMSISFRRYMEMCLYQPGLGYYVAQTRKFGKGGDFVTAPELGDVFTRCLANQVAEVLLACGGDTVLEFGAGSGRLAADMLNALDALGAALGRYLILEPSPDLQQRQYQRISADAPALLERVLWLQGLPEEPIRGCIVANEVLDAMPVSRFRVDAGEVREQTVRAEGDSFAFGYREPPPRLIKPIQELLSRCEEPLPDGYITEFNPNIRPWLRSLADTLEAGAALLIDYGYPGREYYRAERINGTLSCHYRQRTHTDVFFHPGLQDITAHVDFSAAAEAADAAGLDVLGFTSQMAFLVGNGLQAIAQASDPEDRAAHLALSQQIKTLTLPGEMGELFKVLAVGRGIDGGLSGFRAMDQSWRL